MKIAFFSSGLFGLPILEQLVARGHDVTLITKSDTPRGRGLSPQPSPPAELAARLGLPTLKITSMKGDLISWYDSQLFDVAIVVDFGFYIPEKFYAHPHTTMVNVHPSMLPKYRGASPIRRAIWNGEQQTGVSLIKVSKGMDEGDIYLQRAIPIGEKDDVVSLTPKLQVLALDLLDEFLFRLQQGTLVSFPQQGEPTIAPKIKPEEEWIVWRQSAWSIRNQVRALADVGAKTTLLGKVLKVFRADVEESAPDMDAGYYMVMGDRLLVGTGFGVLSIRELQLEGKKRQTAESFVRGLRTKEGTLGE
ncbi:methionyl-tRNA formyltransferase [Coprothermobacteraceae bacterium]|nr:methionyl-tRNA formyltransferase [Coprothermobacteraceae bacterium]